MGGAGASRAVEPRGLSEAGRRDPGAERSDREDRGKEHDDPPTPRAVLSKPSTEKTSKVLEQAGIKVPPQNSPPSKAKDPPKPGHGRNGAQAYRGAERIKIAHGSLQPGNHCPGGLKGKVYLQEEPGIRIRVMGQAPIAAQVYELERLRCNLCGEVYEAEAPPDVGEKKYDESATAMIALLKYGSGVP